MLKISPQFIKTNEYTIKIRTHVSYTGSQYELKNNNIDPKHWIHIVTFALLKSNILIEDAMKEARPEIEALAKTSWEANKRSIVLVDFIVNTKDGKHVFEVGMCACPDNTPLFHDSNTFSRA